MKNILTLSFLAIALTFTAACGQLVTAQDSERIYEVKIADEGQRINNTKNYVGPSGCCSFARSCASVPANDKGAMACESKGGQMMSTKQCSAGMCQ